MDGCTYNQPAYQIVADCARSQMRTGRDIKQNTGEWPAAYGMYNDGIDAKSRK